MKYTPGFRVFFLIILPAMASFAETATKPEPLPDSIGWHRAVYDDAGKLLPWTSWTDALNREMEWYLACPTGEDGYPVFIYTTFMDELYQPYKTEVIPATQNGMGILSYLKYDAFTEHRDPRLLAMARKMGDFLVDECLTPDQGAYPRFMRSTGHHTAFPLDTSSQGDQKYGANVIEPDKGGLAAYALLKLHEVTNDARYLDLARHTADVLTANMRPGSMTRSPWPFRVDSVTGQYWGERSGNMVFILRLFDELIARGQAQFQAPRDALWAWIRDCQFKAGESRAESLWIQFFEDMTEEDNRNAWAPLEMARYLIEKREALDPEWKSHAEQCIQFSVKLFGITKPGSVQLVGEQDSDKRAWGGICAKLGGVAAQFYAAGGGDAYKDLAYRNLNWMTYFIRNDGVACDLTSEPGVREGGWQEDCHTDVIHNFVDAMIAVPEWATEATSPKRAAPPKTIAYSATPNAYFNDHAGDVAKLYDGFFFVAGAWDTDATTKLGLNAEPGTPVPWRDLVRDNIAQLNAAGATENLLGVYFSDAGAWPSPETLLDPAFTDTMTTRFAGIAAQAKELGFRGICVDLEYPYPRYGLDHEVYKYEDYTAEDLMNAASTQARAITDAMLNAYPDAVIVVLPGALWVRPLARAFQLGMLEAMAERDAPGGLHFFAERSYGLLDPVSQAAIPRETDLAVHALVKDPNVLEYWNRRCSVGPGVWPLHMIETGGKDYPVRPWSEELAELEQQMRILRAVAKRYVWSYSANPLWHPYTPEIAQQYQLGVTPFAGAEEAIPGWHGILQDRGEVKEPHLLHLIGTDLQFDRGAITPEVFCDQFGTPAQWLMLGPLANPFDNPAFSAPQALLKPIDLEMPVAGRDSVVRWFPFKNYEPLGSVRIMAAFEWFKTSMASVQLITDVESERPLQAFLHLNWDDGAAVWLNGALIFDQRSYPERGHGLLYRDRYDFETQVPIPLPEGKSRLAVLCVNQKGGWGVNLRITDKDGWPIPGVTFSLPATGRQ